MKGLDKRDMSLLAELDADSHRSLSEYARRLRLGRDLIDYRLRRLKSLGYVLRHQAVIDPFRIGYSLFKTYLKLKARPKEITALFAAIHAHPEVHWSAECSGSWDLFFTCSVHGAREFWKLQHKLLDPFRSLILAQSVATNIEIQRYSRGYLADRSPYTFLVGGESVDAKEGKLDPKDMQILVALSEDARTDTADLSTRIAMTQQGVRNRIKRLEEQGYIRGYTVALNLPAFGRTFYKLKIFSQHFSTKRERELETWCMRHPDVTYLVKQIADCPYEISVEASSYDHLTDIMNELRQRFSQGIIHIETLLVRKQSHKWVMRGGSQKVEKKLLTKNSADSLSL